MGRERGFSSLAELAAELMFKPDSQLHRDVVERLLTGETSWFRDIHPFDILHEQVIPNLVKARALSRTLNIWCGACSTGQEPYSIAMLLLEHFPKLNDWRIRLIATDMSSRMLEHTRSGEYSQLEINRGLPATLLVKYFDQHGRVWKVKDSIRDMVTVEELNLAKSWSILPKPIDVVFMRNVLIYFDIPVKKRILASIRSILAPDGYLFLGGAETTFNLDENFERASSGKGACYRICPIPTESLVPR